ncbi:uncharacterized protein LOC142570482 [Dermacentor variabilis]|uniref:uncharacterized protein LOC142570482 n=1 Tax=Dermacentor variabilis TaxID=34621 RepID=UPI003F5BA23E
MRSHKGEARKGSSKSRRLSFERSRAASGRQKRASTAEPAPSAAGSREKSSAIKATTAAEGASKDGAVKQMSIERPVLQRTRSTPLPQAPSKSERPRNGTPVTKSGRTEDVDEDGNELWTTVSSGFIESLGTDSQLTAPDSVPLADGDVHGLHVIVSPSGVLLEKSDASSPEVEQQSPRTVRFQPGGRKRSRARGELSPSSSTRKARSHFCCDHRVGVLCAVLTTLPAALIVAYSLRLWTTGNVRWQSFCLEYDGKACLAAMEELHELLNPSAEPCDNMYAYTCDQWDRSADALAYNRTYVASSLSKLYETVNRTLLSGPTLRPNVFGRHVLQSLYTSCYASLSAAKTSPLEVPRELSALLVEGEMRNGMEFALNMSLQWGLEMLWGARLERNGSTPSYVHLYAGRSIADKFEGRGHGMTADAVRYLKHVVDGLSKERFATMVDLALRVDKALQSELCCTEGLDSTWVQVTDLDVFSWYIKGNQWWNAFVRYLWKTEPAEDWQKRLVVTGYNQIKNAFATLEQHSDVALLYLYLLASAEVLQYDYRKRVLQSDSEDSGVVYACMEATRRVLSPSWPYVIADVSGYAHVTVAVGDMYEQLLSLSNESPYSTSMDNVTRFRANSQMSGLTLDAFPAFVPIKGVDIIRFSNDFRLQGTFGFDYLRLLSMSQSVVRDRDQPAGLDRLTEDQSKGVLEFSLLTRSLVVPTAYTLSPVFYEQDVPESLNYGTLGSLIAKEMSEMVAPGSPAITTNAATEASGEWWTEASRRSLNK